MSRAASLTDVFSQLQTAHEATSIALGTITAINGTTPGPASGITYDVAVAIGGGTTEVVTAPSVPRFPDDVEVDGLAVGTPVLFAVFGADVAKSFYWLAPVEMPADPEPCPAE